MINRFGSSKRKSEFENANKGLTRLAGRQTDFLDKEWGHGFGFKHATKENKRKMALLALNSFSFQVKKQQEVFPFSSARSGEKDRKEQVQVLAIGLGLERPNAKVLKQKIFANDLKRPIEFNGKYLNKTRIFTTKELQGKFLQVPKRVLVKLAMKEKVRNSGLG